MATLKRASYRDAIDYIACNDDPCERDTAAIEGYVSVALVAAIFGTDGAHVARDVARLRERVA